MPLYPEHEIKMCLSCMGTGWQDQMLERFGYGKGMPSSFSLGKCFSCGGSGVKKSVRYIKRNH